MMQDGVHDHHIKRTVVKWNANPVIYDQGHAGRIVVCDINGGGRHTLNVNNPSNTAISRAQIQDPFARRNVRQMNSCVAMRTPFSGPIKDPLS